MANEIRDVAIAGILFIIFSSRTVDRLFSEKVSDNRMILIILKAILFCICYWIVFKIINSVLSS